MGLGVTRGHTRIGVGCRVADRRRFLLGGRPQIRDPYVAALVDPDLLVNDLEPLLGELAPYDG